jgi:hypothetical protein
MIPFTILQTSDNAMSSEETAIAIVAIIAGSIMVTLIAGIVSWQLLGAWRTRLAVGREKAYQELAHEMAEANRRASAGIQQVLDELSDLRTRTAEIERMLREVG